MNVDKNKQKFMEIYAEEADPVFRYSLLRTSSREVALDITQEVFMRVWKTLSQKREVSHPKSFVFTVARNLIIDWYRKLKPVSLDAMMEDSYESVPFDVVDPDADARIELDSDGKIALKALALLKPEYREPIYLRFVEGLTPQDIAPILGLSANVVSIRITRGMEELKKEMNI